MKKLKDIRTKLLSWWWEQAKRNQPEEIPLCSRTPSKSQSIVIVTFLSLVGLIIGWVLAHYLSNWAALMWLVAYGSIIIYAAQNHRRGTENFFINRHQDYLRWSFENGVQITIPFSRVRKVEKRWGGKAYQVYFDQVYDTPWKTTDKFIFSQGQLEDNFREFSKALVQASVSRGWMKELH